MAERFNDGIIDLSQYRKQKELEEQEITPVFTEPTIITLGAEDDTELQVKYLLLVNLVINNKQFLALESLENTDEREIALVQAVLDEEGNFIGVTAIETDEEYEEVAGIMTQAITASIDAEGDSDGNH